jgi:hypothetical protein
MPSDPAGMIDIELIGNTEQVERMLVFLESRLTISSLMRFLEVRIKPYLKERVDRRFRNEGDDVTGSWAPLSQATRNIRQWGNPQLWDVGPDHPINQRTHEMYEYLTQGTWQVVSSGATGALLSSPREKQNKREMRNKLRRAQQGDSRTPARPVLGLNEADLTFFLAQLAFHIRDESAVVR